MQRIRKNLGEYRLLARLATGGQSEVYLAARNGPHGFFRPVVIKAIPDDFKGELRLEALFYQEATISSRFSHPNVITIHDARRAGNEHFMVMDYVAGQTVADLAQRASKEGQGITVEEALVIICDACRGLEYVHSFEDVDSECYSIVHCDISPQNLMVTYTGLTRVFDFGISQIVGESGALKSDLVGGKFAYMSPEQCLGESVDPRSDIFALGVILYELVTERRLFRRGDRNDVLRAITTEEVAPPSEVAPDLGLDIDEVLARALAKDREQRFGSAREMRKALEEILKARGVREDVIREELGEKVGALFGMERLQVAEALRDARREMSEQVFAPSEESSPEESESEVPEKPVELEESQGPTDREQELEELLARAEDSLALIEGKARRATEVANVLTEEVTRLQRHQKWLAAGLCALSLIAVLIATIAFLSDDSVPTVVAEAMAEE